ncbi:MAG: hypothetical protein AB1629_05895 [Candidatus Omnitrophota bacterium]
MKKNSFFNFLRFKRYSYSLIEGVVILAVLTILVLGGILAYRPMRAQTREASEKVIMAALQAAIDTYYGKYFVWYGESPDLATCTPNPLDLLGQHVSKFGYGGANATDCWSTNLGNPDGVNWQWGYLGDVPLPGGHRWYFYCPHYTGSKGNRYRYNTNDGEGRIEIFSSFGH